MHDEILKNQNCRHNSSAKTFGTSGSPISNFEDYLTRQGVIVLKFFLHVSRDEQKRRFIERLEEPDKYWKFAPSDVSERKFWDDYMHAFEEAIRPPHQNCAMVRRAGRQ